MLTAKQVAERMTGREYGSELLDGEEDELKQAGLVVAFGYSDDYLEIRGVACAEFGAWNGTTCYVCDGVAYKKPRDGAEMTLDDAREYLAMEAKPNVKVTAHWCPPAPFSGSWLIECDMPYIPFDIMEDGELFCRGAVFTVPKG